MRNIQRIRNVVGYQTLTLPAQQYVMIGVAFNGVSGSDGIDIQDLFSDPIGQGFVGAKTPASAGSAYQLMYWDPNEPTKYVQLYLCSNTTGGREGKWCLTQKPNDATWGSAKNAICTKRVTSGMGFWLIRPSGSYATEQSVTMSGKVVVAENGRSYTIRGNGGYTMVSGGFTTDFDLNGQGIDWISKGFKAAGTPASCASADQIMYWNPSTETANKYVMLYLCNNTGSSNLRYNKWCLTQKPTDTSWGAAKNAVCTKAIPAGRGFWMIRPKSSDDLTFTLPQPYSL